MIEYFFLEFYFLFRLLYEFNTFLKLLKKQERGEKNLVDTLYFVIPEPL